MTGLITLFIALITTQLFGVVSHAAPGINQTMSFQARLLYSNGAVVPDGHYNIQFKIYQDGNGTTAGNTAGSPAGILRWTETYVNNGGTNGLIVKNGYVSVDLGSQTPFGTSVDWNQDTLWLSMNVAGFAVSCTTFGTAPCVADGEMLPMKRMTATPFSLNSRALDGKTANNFVQLGQGVQTDASSNTSSIFINKTNNGNLIQLQNASADIFTVTNAGDIAFGGSTNHSISVATAPADTAGRQLTVSAGTGGSGSSGTGGDLVLQGGAAGTGGGGAGNGSNGPNVLTSEDYEGETNGTNLTTANTIFDIYVSTGSATFSNEWSIKGTSSAKYVTSGTGYQNITTTNLQATRWYMSLANYPSTPSIIGNARNATTAVAQLRILTDGSVQMRNGTVAIGALTAPLPQNTPIRAEWKIDGPSGRQDIQFFWGANLHGSTPNTSTFTTAFNGDTFNNIGTGIIQADTGFTMYVDEWAHGNDWLGPLQYNNGNGGGVSIDAGAKTGDGSGGSIFIGSSNAAAITVGSTTTATSQSINIGTNNTSGSTSNVTIGSGGTATNGTTTVQGKDGVTIKTNGTTRATFSNSNTVYFGNGVSAAAPDSSILQGTNSTTTAVSGGSLTLQGGNATAGDANGGNVTLSGGTGSGTGAKGLVVLATPTFSTIANDPNCYTSGANVAANCTVATASINNASALMIGFSTTGRTATLPDPSITTAGRILYITASTTSQNFTLSMNGGGAGNLVNVKAKATLTLIWNGADWTTAGGASSASVQETYVGTSTNPTVQIGNGVSDGSLTLLTVDRAASAPSVSDANATLGSMYYDTTIGKLQCYEADGWGACSSSPDIFMTLSPEYTNAVMNGTAIGTMSSDFCSDTLNINDGSSAQPTICGTNETYNFYKWTTAEVTAQTKNIYVTYQLPSNFKSFATGTTSLKGRTNSTNSTVSYQIYRNRTSGLTTCGSAVTASTGNQTTWQTGTASGGSDPASCSFAAGDSIVFKIMLSASNNANAYASNLNFTYSNN